MKEADYRLIQYYHQEKNWPIAWMCEILGISRAAYYQWLHRKPGKRETENKELLEKIQEVAKGNNQLFGRRKMKMTLDRGGKKCFNHKRIARLMDIHGLQSVYRRKRKRYKPSEPVQTAENILARDFQASRPNEKWGTDITELSVPGVPQKAYISTIYDLYDTFPVAYTISKRCDSDLVNRTMDLALEANPDGAEIFHSDRGSQYTRAYYQDRLKEVGMKPSMSRVGRCIDNGPVEGFQGQIKDIFRILNPDVSNWEELEAGIKRSFDYYINEYPKERFKGKTVGEVRREALSATVPVAYPIKKDSRIVRFWKKIEGKRSLKTEAQAG